MAKFRKKTIIEAEQFFHNRPLPFRDAEHSMPYVRFNGDFFYVETAHGDEIRVEDGDWIIPERTGDWRAYPCKPDIFEATYEIVAEGNHAAD